MMKWEDLRFSFWLACWPVGIHNANIPTNVENTFNDNYSCGVVFESTAIPLRELLLPSCLLSPVCKIVQGAASKR